MSLRVLIVDDAGFIRHLLAKVITDLGHHVVAEARTGTEAVTMISKMQIDVVLMDLVLPEKNGVEATMAARELKPNLPIVAMSTMDDAYIQHQAMQAGCYDYLHKPFSAESVGEVLARIQLHYSEGAKYG